ncbi:phage/plasmid replication domain-containing protein [Algibacter luteus]|uniref:Replication-associated protein G2P N-terminal domain-containing protein n=1 Tax=Algibacter luteus TaxID=1178825 RepID=A0A1M6DMC1_9FLAO|nr:hypothetical protein SAMN05216261_1643 [Algibacter luteus]
MYDNVGLWMPSDRINWSGYKDTIPALLSNITYTEKQNGNWWINGSLENLKIAVGEAGISIIGSPNKYVHGYNFAALTRQEFQHGIEKISDTFSIDIKKANTSKIDIAHNFCMQEEVKHYYHYLGICKYYKRLAYENSLYYSNKQRTIVFYDKVKEGKKNGETIPLAWLNKNILRYEFRLKGRILKQLNRSNLYAEDLYKDEFYIQIIDRWILEYQNITKNKIMNPNKETLTNKEAKDYLLSALVAEFGQNKVLSIVDGWNSRFTTNKEAQRFRKSLNSLSGLTLESDLIQELDTKINRVKDYYR